MTNRHGDDPEGPFAVWPKDGSEADARTYYAMTARQAAEQRARDDNTADLGDTATAKIVRFRELWAAAATVQLGVTQATVWFPIEVYSEFKKFVEDDDDRRRVAYCARDGVTGRIWTVLVGVVAQPSFVALDVYEIPMPPATHVLWGGHVLCEDLRLRGVPRDGPDGQRWISLKDVADGAAAPDDRCETCWTKAPGLVDGIRQIGSDR